MTEHQHQKALIRWFDLAYPDFRGLLFATPNGGQRHPAVAAKLKAEGVRRGVPDLCLPVARHGFHGLFIELKTETGRLTREQAQWLERLDAEGFMAVWCRGWANAQQTLIDYLGAP